MNVLSLFDGLSCGMIALERAGIKVDNYYASEIDKYSEKVSAFNYPDIIRLGDVTKWRDWGIDFSKIDLLLAGFPCQAWSLAGKQGGDNDPRGALVYDLIDIWNEIKSKNPNMKFLFENVKMKKEFIDYINNLFGVTPVLINSALVSAQNRERLYWTNIPGEGVCSLLDDIPKITQPKDKGIVLRDILEDFADTDREKYLTVTTRIGNVTEKRYLEKSMHQMVKKIANKNPCGRGIGGNIYDIDSYKSPTLTVGSTVLCGKNNKCINIGDAGLNNYESVNRVYSIDDKSPTLLTQQGGNKEPKISKDFVTWRKLTPLECERLQTIPDNFTACVSNSQRYKMIGNSWTADVIAHILKGLKSL